MSVLHEMSSLNHHCFVFSFPLCLSAATPCLICPNAKSTHKLVLLSPLFESTLLLGRFFLCSWWALQDFLEWVSAIAGCFDVCTYKCLTVICLYDVNLCLETSSEQDLLKYILSSVSPLSSPPVEHRGAPGAVYAHISKQLCSGEAVVATCALKSLACFIHVLFSCFCVHSSVLSIWVVLAQKWEMCSSALEALRNVFWQLLMKVKDVAILLDSGACHRYGTCSIAVTPSHQGCMDTNEGACFQAVWCRTARWQLHSRTDILTRSSETCF